MNFSIIAHFSFADRIVIHILKENIKLVSVQFTEDVTLLAFEVMLINTLHI